MNSTEPRLIKPLDDYSYILWGDPTPLARPRFTKGHIWDSQKKIKVSAAIDLDSQHNIPPLDGPLHMDVWFFFNLPQRLRRRAQRLPSPAPSLPRQLNPEDFYTYYLPHDTRPDLDNLVKFVCDTANGILYHDDKQICSINALKAYDTTPRTHISIRRIL